MQKENPSCSRNVITDFKLSKHKVVFESAKQLKQSLNIGQGYYLIKF